MKSMQPTTKLGAALLKACERRAKQLGIKRYAVRRLAMDAHVAQPHVTRAMNGQVNLSREILAKLCKALESPHNEIVEIFNAAGYVPPEELDEVIQAA